MHPAVKFCEVVAKKASDEGWKLLLDRNGFIWMKNEDKSTATGSAPTMRLVGPNPRVHMMEMFHEACCHLERHLSWNLEVEL